MSHTLIPFYVYVRMYIYRFLETQDAIFRRSRSLMSTPKKVTKKGMEATSKTENKTPSKTKQTRLINVIV